MGEKIKRTFYAHTLSDHPPSDWEILEDHLKLVAEGNGREFPGARGFAQRFGAGDWGALLGWWHDLGKYSDSFQNYIKQAGADSADGHSAEISKKVDHSTAGAQYAAQKYGVIGKILAYTIAGHHAGLPDTDDNNAGLNGRLKKSIDGSWQKAAPQWITSLPCPQFPALDLAAPGESKKRSFQAAFFIRMLFSALVDGDFLATEQFMQPEKAELRPADLPTIQALLTQLNIHLLQFDNPRRDTDTMVNQKRHQVLHACREKATLSPGFFSLQVPTGGGKTLSALAFALEHGAQNDMQRVIYAAPFTSIIEQNGDVFRSALGSLADRAVIEHHSNLDPDDPQKQNQHTRLAAENWDAPIVVTTNVQLFESLFACKTSRCRKLHHIAGSVIILDEAQTLPVDLLRPTLMALDELVRNYDCSVVLCTATQPALGQRDDFSIGLEQKKIRPIIDRPLELHKALKRVQVQSIGKLEDEDLVARLKQEAQVLCIVNTRAHAASLFAALQEQADEQTIFHLSAQMCPAHRNDILEQIRAQLNAKEPCQVISTQLIEAGVDVDFPVVYRAMAGLDSIAQAAGRCNREGALADESGQPQLGRVYVFDTDKLPRMLRQTADVAQQVVPTYKDDLLAPKSVEHYFKLHYWQKGGENGQGWDKEDVLGCFDNGGQSLQFRQAAAKYKWIDDSQTSVLVPYGEKGDELISQLLAVNEQTSSKYKRLLLRRLQRYTVTLYSQGIAKLRENAVLLEHPLWLDQNVLVLNNHDAYDLNLGIKMDAAGMDVLMG